MTDSNCSFSLVSREHPDNLAGCSERLNRLGNTVLQLIFNRCRANQLKPLLNLARHHLNFHFSVLDRALCFIILLFPLFIDIFFDLSFGEQKCAEALPREAICMV